MFSVIGTGIIFYAVYLSFSRATWIAFIFIMPITLLLVVRYRSHILLLPAWLFPYSKVRVFFHRLRGVKIGKNVEIGSMVIIDNIYPHKVSIGNNVTIVSQTMITAHDFSYKYSRNGEIVEGAVEKEDNAFIGGLSIILPGIKVGKSALVGAGSVVTKDVEPFSIVAGNPAKKIK